MNSIKCLRVLADENQLKQCKEDIQLIEQDVRQLTDLLSLAGNEVRFKILLLLHQEKQMCPCDLSDVLDMTVPAISQHLRKMKDKDLIRSRKVGQTIFYQLNEAHKGMLAPLFDLVNNSLNVK